MAKDRDKTDELKATMGLYCNLMGEIKNREQAIGLMISGPITNPAGQNLAGQIVYESCYLQLRFICELIAVGCLTVHGDIGATKSLKKAYQADQIVKRLEELHPTFYPQPVKIDEAKKMTRQQTGFLTKADLIELYRRSGDRLHRGSIEKIHTKFNPNFVNLTRIGDWRIKIINLLNHHWIAVHDSHDFVGIQMGTLGEAPRWNFWKATPKPKSGPL